MDFTAAPRAVRSGRVLLGCGLVAILAGSADLALTWQDHRREQAELAALAQRGRAPEPGLRRSVPVNPAALRVAAGVARDLAAPWPELLRSMEASRSADITLVRVEPVAARGSLRITGEARHADAMLDYLERLRAQGLAEVVLTSHEVEAKQPGTPIRFQAQARWADLAEQGRHADAPRPEAGTPGGSPDAGAGDVERFVLNARAAR
jgi:hypothetical protein